MMGMGVSIQAAKTAAMAKTKMMIMTTATMLLTLVQCRTFWLRITTWTATDVKTVKMWTLTVMVISMKTTDAHLEIYNWIVMKIKMGAHYRCTVAYGGHRVG